MPGFLISACLAIHTIISIYIIFTHYTIYSLPFRFIGLPYRAFRLPTDGDSPLAESLSTAGSFLTRLPYTK